MRVAYLIEPPFNYVDEAGAVTGCDIELARYVLGELGIHGVEFVETEFAQLLPGLAEKLGEDTLNLLFRVGLHSGPITGGVLRGSKSRFQLFGTI